jgi:hypothetical protein
MNKFSSRFASVLHSFLRLLQHRFSSQFPGSWIFISFIVLSFIWAYIPFIFSITMSPALSEMQKAVSACRNELLFADTKQQILAGDRSRDIRSASAESVVKRALSHAAAAAVNTGRSSQVFGLVIPVGATSFIFFVADLVLFHAAL